jgi:hypothetical protein
MYGPRKAAQIRAANTRTDAEWQRIYANMVGGTRCADRNHAKWCQGQLKVITKYMEILNIPIPTDGVAK